MRAFTTLLRPWRTFAALLLTLALGVASAQDLLPVPALTGHVIDQTGTLDAAQRQALEAKLAAFEAEKGSQVVVLMVPTTAPEDIAAYAFRIASNWKIGRREVGDGVLMVVAKDDRRMRIEVAKALEGAIPDIAAGRIIDGAMKPRFRENDFAGLEAAADQVIARIKGEPLPPLEQANSGQFDNGKARSGGFNWTDLAIFGFFGVMVGGRIARAIFGKGIGSVLTGGAVGVLAMLVTSSLVVAVLAALAGLVFTLLSSSLGALGGLARGGRSGGFGGGLGGGGFGGGGWGGGGGGGFGSGGGGDFGGGGASGNW